MVWGYGPVGYGAYRTKRVLTENPEAGQVLSEVASFARDEGGPASFGWLAQPGHHLRYLGVAFATKYLFFCTAAGGTTPALVLDRLVRDWMFENLGWPLSLEWDVGDYQAYVDTMCGWATEVGIESGNLEMLVFQLAANADPRSLWSAPELFARSRRILAPRQPPVMKTRLQSCSDCSCGQGTAVRVGHECAPP